MGLRGQGDICPRKKIPKAAKQFGFGFFNAKLQFLIDFTFYCLFFRFFIVDLCADKN